jgi:rsbT co-antagonist protein RsbR
MKNKKKEIFDNWIKVQMKNQFLKEEILANEDLNQESEKFLTELLKIVSLDDYEDVYSPSFEKVRSILTEITLNRAKQGFTPRETGLYIFSLKEALITTLKIEYKNDLEKYIENTLKINKLIDELGIVTFESYIKGREEIIQRQTNEINEISTPIIKIWDGILALPIIGTLDSSRTQIVMENLLNEIVATGSRIAILDISGVPAVDSLVAQHLIKTVSATRLMGVECIISGIRPEIAQTIVHLGIDLSDIITKSSMAAALAHALLLLKTDDIN